MTKKSFIPEEVEASRSKGAKMRYINASEYFAGKTASDFAVTADTTDEDLLKVTEAEAKKAWTTDGFDVLVGLLAYLTRIRDDERVSRVFRETVLNSEHIQDDPALALDTGRSIASRLIPPGVTGYFNDETLTFTSDVNDG